MDLKFPKVLEEKFQSYQKSDQNSPALALALLGDENYVKKMRMPKYNVPVDMLREPHVALRYRDVLGIPTSKAAHAARAENFQNLALSMDSQYNSLVQRAIKKYGSSSTYIAAIVHDHFPSPIKDRLRFLAYGGSLVKDAVHLHKFLSTTRSAAIR